MKKRKILLLTALAAALCICILAFGTGCIGRIQNHSDDEWSQVHAYMTGEHIVDFPVSETGKLCVFQWETGRGSFSAEITNAGGEVLYSTSSDTNGDAAFPADSDLTLRINAQGHGGVFSLILRDDPNQPEGHQPEPVVHDSGSHTGGTFTATYDFRRYDGKYVNFFVENLGNGPVVITINGENKRTIPAGSGGHITSQISATTLPQPMTVKCASNSGEDVNINWKVAQRTSK